MMQNKGWQKLPEIWGKGGRCPIITSGLGLSWAMVPLGPWSLDRGGWGPAGKLSRATLEARWRIEQEPLQVDLVREICYKIL